MQDDWTHLLNSFWQTDWFSKIICNNLFETTTNWDCNLCKLFSIKSISKLPSNFWKIKRSNEYLIEKETYKEVRYALLIRIFRNWILRWNKRCRWCQECPNRNTYLRPWRNHDLWRNLFPCWAEFSQERGNLIPNCCHNRLSALCYYFPGNYRHD